MPGAAAGAYGSRGNWARNDVATVGTTSARIMDEAPRVVFALANTSTGGQTITVCPGHPAAVANKGIVLAPGDKWVESTGEGFECFQGPVQAIASAAAGQISIFER